MMKVAIASLSILSIVMTGCSTEELVVEVVKELVGSAKWGTRQFKDQRSAVARTTGYFYPDGVPERISDLPDLPSNALSNIEKDLQKQLSNTEKAVKKYRSTLEDIYKRPISEASVRVRLSNGTAAIALLSANSDEIFIDTRVVQGLFRGVLLASLTSDKDFKLGAPGSETEANQKKALAVLISARKALQERSAVPYIALAQGASKQDWSKNDPFENSFAVLFDQLESVFHAWTAERISNQYDDAVAFLVAHEFAHKALNHYARRDAGEKQRDLELEADHFAVIINILQRNSSPAPNDGYLFKPPLTEEWLTEVDGRWCYWNTYYSPDGFNSFFSYGYDMAGMSLDEDKENVYPSKIERLNFVADVSEVALKAIDSAQDDLGTCYTRSTGFSQKVKNDPKLVAEDRRMYLERKIKEDPNSIISDSYNIQLKNFEIYKIVYSRYVQDMTVL